MIRKDHRDWALFPRRLWSVYELIDPYQEWWKRGNYRTWKEAMDRVRELAKGRNN